MPAKKEVKTMATNCHNARAEMKSGRKNGKALTKEQIERNKRIILNCECAACRKARATVDKVPRGGGKKRKERRW